MKELQCDFLEDEEQDLGVVLKRNWRERRQMRNSYIIKARVTVVTVAT